MKKIYTKLLGIVIVIIATACLLPSVFAETYGDLTYKIQNNEITITKCNYLATGHLVVPETIDGYPVTTIGSMAFEDRTNLKSIELPDGITTIGYRAFAQCYKLESINLPDNITTIEEAFAWCTSLTSIELPDTITTIGEGTFFNCEALKSINLPNGVTSIGSRAFEGCTALQSIELPNRLKTIGVSAFLNCEALKSINLPNGVTSIGNLAFYGCTALQSIELPDSITTIDGYLFDGCTDLESITIGPFVNNIGNNAFNGCNNLKSVYYKSTSSDWSKISIGDNNEYLINATKHFKSLEATGILYINHTGTLWGVDIEEEKLPYVKEIVVSPDVTKIAPYVFAGEIFTNLEKVTLPVGLEEIASGAFHSSKTLKEINLPSSLLKIGGYAFYGNDALKSIEIPASLTSIGDCAFYGTGLESVKYAGKRLDWSDISISKGNAVLESFYCEGETEGQLTDTVKYIYDGVDTVTITGVGYVFDSEIIPSEIAESIKHIHLDKSIYGFGANAFTNLPNLEKVTGGKNMRYLGNYAFKNCTKLETVEFLSVEYFTSISYGTFYGCSSLKNVVLSENMKTIYGRAFEGCSSLTEITVPKGVTNVGEYAFANCSGIKTFTVESGVEKIGAGAIQNCSALTTLNLPETIIEVRGYAVFGCYKLKTVNFDGNTEKWTAVTMAVGNNPISRATVNCK